MSATVSVGFRANAITTSCGFCQESRCGSSRTRAYSAVSGGWCWCATCPNAAAANPVATRIRFVDSLLCHFFRRLEPVQQVRITRKLLQHRESRSRPEPRPHQPPISRCHLLIVLEQSFLGRHVELAPHEILG